MGYFSYKINIDKKDLFISKLYILKNQRGMGVGRTVLKYLEQICRDHDLEKITLTVFHKNINSLKAYEKWGFIKQGLIERKFENGLSFHDIKMERLLTQ